MRKDLHSMILNGPQNRAERRNAMRLVKDEARKATQRSEADAMSGAGFPVDRQVRRFQKTCNQDLLHGIDPPSPKFWDVVSGFYVRQPDLVVPEVRILPEKDHAFLAGDFLDFVRGTPDDGEAMRHVEQLPEGVIHNFSVIDRPDDVVFEEEGRTIAFSGISLVRRGNLLHWLTAGGDKADLAAVTAGRRAELAVNEAAIRQSNPRADPRAISDILNPTAALLPGSVSVWDSPAFGLFNLSTRRHEIRASTREWTVSQAVFSDQFEHRFAEAYDRDPAAKRLVDKTMAQLAADRLFFEIAETAFALPMYFAARVTYVRPVEVPTGMAQGSSASKHAMKAPPGLRPMSKTVATLRIGGRAPEGGGYSPPRYVVEVDGFWRSLPVGSVGKDAEGRAVEGRTWVRGHARWKDLPPRVGVIHVKSPVADAMATARALAARDGGEVVVET